LGGAITAVVHSFTNENISGTGDVLAAFVGDECRGFATHPPEGTRLFLKAWSNDPGVSNPDGTYIQVKPFLFDFMIPFAKPFI
jgi:hypothetical protein